jgi:dTMP kinase
LTREPSDGPIGVLLREILAGRHTADATALSLLFAADRVDHLTREVEPALLSGKLVISDRWYHSSLAYQGTSEERAWIRTLNRRARVPDLTILLEVSVKVAATRRVDAGRSPELFDALEIQDRVATGYREVMEMLAAEERIETINGERSVSAVADDVERLVRDLMTRGGDDETGDVDLGDGGLGGRLPPVGSNARAIPVGRG